MMKSSELQVIVDSVEEAVKFYTEKLTFDITNLEQNKESSRTLMSARLRKGKCIIVFKLPLVEELAEFSFIKRCANRCIELFMETKKGIEKYYQKCQKKDIRIISELKTVGNVKTFTMRDPFGITLIVSQQIAGTHPSLPKDFIGMTLPPKAFSITSIAQESELLDEMCDHLRIFGVLRRSAKKYSKLFLKHLNPKKKKTKNS